ncbi:MAG: PAS domain S-box protein, partial [Bacteroidetes bacterium]|nr:PAS domain S-box protein [Bacteroidota bacterium]
AKQAFIKWKKTERLRNVELSIKTKSGKKLYILLNVDVVKNKEGEFEYALSIQRDITDRKEAEIALAESEEKFRNIFENMDNGYILSDLDGIIQLVNSSTVKILGYKQENDLIGKNANKTLYAYPEEREELVEALSLQGRVNNHELTLKTKEGHLILAECNIHLIRDDTGKPTEVEGIFQDITLRREVESSLTESEAQYKSIVNSIPDVVYSYSMNTGGVFYSANVERILGYTQNWPAPQELYQFIS